MSATHRLFSIIQTLRSANKPVTAQQLSEQHEVSLRTIYRDIAELQNQHIPVEGEAGIGYILHKDYQMPPLMLTIDELEAALLGAHWVAERGDTLLAKGAQTLIDKLNNVMPDHLKHAASTPIVAAPCLLTSLTENIATHALRDTIRQQRKIQIEYTNSQGENSQRTVWPFMVAYFDTIKIIVAWCEKRQAFRHFRTDRIRSLEVLDVHFDTPIAQLQAAWETEEKQKESPTVIDK